jgi:hypothetical protein
LLQAVSGVEVPAAAARRGDVHQQARCWPDRIAMSTSSQPLTKHTPAQNRGALFSHRGRIFTNKSRFTVLSQA